MQLSIVTGRSIQYQLCARFSGCPGVDTTTVELPKVADVYRLSCNGSMCSRTMLLNGRELVLCENDKLPCLCGETTSGKLELAPSTCAFIVL